MRKVSKQQLVAAAMKARLQAVAPYSGFRVGAALLAGSGKVYLGANVESASYGLTCCAERVALFKALTEGERQFETIAVVAPTSHGTPCGACRQLLAEYAPKAAVLTADSRKPARICEFEISKLLPAAFTLLPRGKKNMAKKVTSRRRA
jgi:cytidine deaminase